MHDRGGVVNEDRPTSRPLPSVLNRLNEDADRQWQRLTPPVWITAIGVLLMIAIVVVIAIAIWTDIA